MAYTVRRAGPADRPHVEALLAEIFPSGDVAARYEWMHVRNPHGTSLVWLAVDDSGEIAACTSYFPRQIVMRGRRALAALGGDCWVRPKFRRRGIAGALHAQGRKEMPAEGIEVMFGTPTPANLTPLQQTGAKNIGFAVRYARPLMLPRVPLVGALLSLGWDGGRLEPAARPDPRIDEVWAEVAGEISVGTVRDAAFYDWRFAGAPSGAQHPFVIVERGRAFAACALEDSGAELRVIDLIAPRARFGAALGAIVRHASANHPECRTVSVRFVEEHGRALGLWRWGFFPRGQTVFNILLPEGEPDSELFYDPASYYLSFADTDVDRG